MRQTYKSVLFATAFALLAASATEAATTLKIATIAPPKTPWFSHLEKWRDRVEKASNGELILQLYPSGQLGNEYDVYKQVARGRVDIGVFSGAVISANIPELGLMSTPFLFDKASTIDCIYDREMRADFEDLIGAKKMKNLQWGETGWISAYAMDDLSDPAVAKGYKIRTAPTPMSKLMWESVGASGIEVPYIETPAALQTGIVKGGETTILGFMAFGLAKIAPNYLDLKQYHQAGATLISQKRFGSLSPELQKILTDSLPPIAEVRTAIRGMSDALIKKFAATGGHVRDMKNGHRTAWAAKVSPNWPDYVKTLGGQSSKLWPKILAAKKTCGG
ncbi:MAG: TRAP transporter substrate-binding protein DctP [Pseudomonas marincola]